MEIPELYSHFIQSKGISTDSRDDLNNKLFFALKGENFDGNDFVEAALEAGALLAVSDDERYKNQKGVVVVEDGLTCLQKLATFHRKELAIPIVAVTGSNGKTTTKELIAEVLSEAYEVVFTKGNLNNHIGVPLTLLKMNESTEVGVVEMGANHQGEIALLCHIAQPNFGYITNFGKAHLEGFGGFEGVIKGKSELYNYLKNHDGKIFVNNEDAIQVKQSKGGDCYYFGEGKEVDCQVEFKGAEPFAEVFYNNETITSHLMGDYNAKNMMAAIAVGRYFEVGAKAIKKAIENYIPTNNRSQIIERKSNLIFLDAYNANPTSMKLAIQNIESLSTKKYKVVLLGDMFEVGETTLEEHQQIVDYLEQSSIDMALVCGACFYKTQVKNVEKFPQFTDLKARVSQQELKDAAILVKGSRGMAMERVLEVLPARL